MRVKYVIFFFNRNFKMLCTFLLTFQSTYAYIYI